MLATCPELFPDGLPAGSWNPPTCYGLIVYVADLLWNCYREVANLLRTCYGETGVMDFGLNTFSKPDSMDDVTKQWLPQAHDVEHEEKTLGHGHTVCTSEVYPH